MHCWPACAALGSAAGETAVSLRAGQQVSRSLSHVRRVRGVGENADDAAARSTTRTISRRAVWVINASNPPMPSMERPSSCSRPQTSASCGRYIASEASRRPLGTVSRSPALAIDGSAAVAGFARSRVFSCPRLLYTWRCPAGSCNAPCARSARSPSNGHCCRATLSHRAAPLQHPSCPRACSAALPRLDVANVTCRAELLMHAPRPNGQGMPRPFASLFAVSPVSEPGPGACDPDWTTLA